MDLGRAWGGNDVDTLAPGWLANAGIGLRIVSARAAFGNVLHVDLVFPIDADVAVKKVQFLVKTRTSFWSAARGTRIAAMRSSMVRSDPLHRQAATRRQTTRDRIQRSPS